MKRRCGAVIGARRGQCDRAARRRARRKNRVADRDLAALAHDQIDAEILVTEGGAQRAWDIEIAPAGRRIDVGRPAAAVLAVDREHRAADPDVAADPVEFLPGLGTVDVDIGAKAQRIDLDTPLLFEAAHGRQIDQRNHIVRLVHEMPAGERTSVGGAGSAGSSCQKKFSTSRDPPRRQAAPRRPAGCLASRSAERSTSRQRVHARQASSSISMTNRPFFAHCGSWRSIGAPGRASAKMRSCGKRLVGLERDARQRLRAQPLDRIAIDLADRGHRVARLPRLLRAER